MKELSKAEEQIMQVLWDLDRAFVKEIIDRLPDPKPAYNTVSTIVRILQDKGFVGHEAYGKSHCYYPLVDKNTYSRKFFEKFYREPIFRIPLAKWCLSLHGKKTSTCKNWKSYWKKPARPRTTKKNDLLK